MFSFRKELLYKGDEDSNIKVIGKPNSGETNIVELNLAEGEELVQGITERNAWAKVEENFIN